MERSPELLVEALEEAGARWVRVRAIWGRRIWGTLHEERHRRRGEPIRAKFWNVERRVELDAIAHGDLVLMLRSGMHPTQHGDSRDSGKIRPVGAVGLGGLGVSRTHSPW